VSDDSILEGWPGRPAAVLFRMREGELSVRAAAGALVEPRPWASVSKMAVALAFGVEIDWGLHDYSESCGPRSATLAHLLSHSSGLGLERDDPVAPVGVKRIYSNYGVDLAVASIVGENEPGNWLDARVFRPLGMASTTLRGRPAADVIGSTNDLFTLGAAWLRPDVVSRPTRDKIIAPHLAGLDGVVPGFGRFAPCPWGLGPELHGAKHHWMGDWPASSFGHFGLSGSLMLLDADEGIGLVATSTVAFGPWAVSLWPGWTSAMRQVALAS
jgi:CubicO group peptidase (beta-lactamase class C family)